ncbi:MAG: hypothetical protein KF779_05600 [Hyphomonadaceae bacterium]|nr:hypothetical protein [Hyphomonadaceae bacterium]
MTSAGNDAKASFDELYAQADPRNYFSVLGSLDYAIPDLAKPIIRQVAAAFRAVHGRNATILDLGSSYGVNAALFRYPISVDMIRRRYARREMMDLTSEEVRTLDRAFFASWPRVQPERIIAADVSPSAIDYAQSVGIIDDGIAYDFEAEHPTPLVAEKLSDVDLIISTGTVGYVTEKTFDALLQTTTRAPWVVSFVLRMFDYEPIAARLERDGLTTEKLRSAAFVQRRFYDENEAKQVIGVLRSKGIDPAGLESEGLLAAELYVSRPKDQAAVLPLDWLVRVVSGRNLSFGARLVHVGREGERLVAPLKP